MFGNQSIEFLINSIGKRTVVHLNPSFFYFFNSFFVIALFCSSCALPGHNLDKKKIDLAIHKQKDTRLLQDIPYGSDTIQKLDIYFPSGLINNNKAIMYVHGGAWCAGDKTEATHWAKYFRDKGYTFVCINYRLTHTPQNHIHPAQIQDIDAAVNFVLSKAGEWQIKKDKLIIMGASAGGHLALLYAYRYNNEKKIKLAISLCSIIDLTDEKLLKADIGDMNGGTMVSWYIGDTITNELEQWKSASPLFNIIQTSVSTFFIHGKKDEIIPYQQSLKAYKLFRKYKIPSGLLLLDNVDHDLLSIDLRKEFNEIDEFIRNNLDVE